MEISPAARLNFTENLLRWHELSNNRALPWKNEPDPYLVWLSEVMLQQTRALQALPYYLKFKEQYPTVVSLAQAPDDEVFRAWQGLGYYSRCRNMLTTARYVADRLHGVFPATHEGLLNLKGVGAYTAAAIASFAYGLPYAVLDGNVCRILSRFFAIDQPADDTTGKKLFANLAQQLLDASRSAACNQAIMDLGATVCTPGRPLCNICPLLSHCVAGSRGTARLFPVKSRKLAVKSRYFHYLLLEWNQKIWVQQRTEKDIWQNLYELFLVEDTQALEMNDITEKTQFKSLDASYTVIGQSFHSKQRLTHQLIYAQFYTIQLQSEPHIKVPSGKWVAKNELKNIAFPKTVVSFLENLSYF